MSPSRLAWLAALIAYAALAAVVPRVGGLERDAAREADVELAARTCQTGAWPRFDGARPDDPPTARGLYYPPTWAGGAATAAGAAPRAVIGALHGAHLALGALLVHLWLRRRGWRASAALGGVAAAIAVAFVVPSADVGWPLAWAPLALLAVDRAAARPGARRGIVIGGAVGLAGLAGALPAAGAVAVATVAYAAWRLRDRRRGTLALVAAATTAAAMVLVTSVPASAHGLRLLAWWAAVIAALCAALPPRPPREPIRAPAGSGGEAA